MIKHNQPLTTRDYATLSNYISGEKTCESDDNRIDGYHLETSDENPKTETPKKKDKHDIDRFLRYLFVKLQPYLLFGEVPPVMTDEYWSYSKLYHQALELFNRLLDNGTYLEKILKRDQMQKRLTELRKKHNNRWDDFTMAVSWAEYALRNAEANHAKELIPEEVEPEEEDSRYIKNIFNQYYTSEAFEPVPYIDYIPQKQTKAGFNSNF